MQTEFLRYLVKITDSMLDDDHGISKETYDLLLRIFSEHPGILLYLINNVDATDNRFYYPTGFLGIEANINWETV